VSVKNLSLKENQENTLLPDFWPEKAIIDDSSTLEINWLPEEQLNGTQYLVQKHLYYRSHAAVQIHAVYIKPAEIPNGVVIPGLVMVHGGGHNYMQVYPLGKYLAESLGFGILLIDSPGINSPNYSSTGVSESAASCTNVSSENGPKGSFYYHNVVALLRGVTLLQSLPEINMSLVGIAGFSGGGIASLIANGVESKYQRIAFAVSMAVAGDWSEEHSGKSPVEWYGLEWNTEKCNTFLNAYEPLIYASLAHAPTLMLDITNDRFFNLEQIQKTFSQLPDIKLKALSILIGFNHWFLGETKFWVPVKIWCQLITSGKEPYSIPEINYIKTDNGSIKITCEQISDNRIDEIGILFNIDRERSVEDWKALKEVVQEGQDIYSWTIDVSTATKYVFYPAVYSDELLLFTGEPLFLIKK
jgi:hypothetical protein